MSIFRPSLSRKAEMLMSTSSDAIASALTKEWGVSQEFAKIAALVMQERKDAALDLLAHTGSVLPMKAPDSHLRAPAGDNEVSLQKAA